MRTPSFVIDPLYGGYYLDSLIGELAKQPEIQRLREVRLSNINSEYLPGSANISRYEHSMGVAYLALRFSEANRASVKDKYCLSAAALLHDVAITPFGHLFEEALQYAGIAFDHERWLETVFSGKGGLGAEDHQVFRGRVPGFRRVLLKRQFREVGLTPDDVLQTKQGKGPLGPLIAGDLDLDNVDNVCRMAYHLGVRFDFDLPLRLAESLFLREGRLGISRERLSCIYEWLELRGRLYTILMTNPTDFAAKATLLDAMRIGLTGLSDEFAPVLSEIDCFRTDAEILQILRSYPPTGELIASFELGHYYRLLGLFWLDSTAVRTLRVKSIPDAVRIRSRIAEQLGISHSDVITYRIKDKRTRVIESLMVGQRGSSGGGTPQVIGGNSGMVLLGILSRRRTGVDVSEAELLTLLRGLTHEGVVSICDPSVALAEVMPEISGRQLGLF